MNVAMMGCSGFISTCRHNPCLPEVCIVVRNQYGNSNPCFSGSQHFSPFLAMIQSQSIVKFGFYIHPSVRPFHRTIFPDYHKSARMLPPVVEGFSPNVSPIFW